jgi:serine/threonine protein phosphatase PrpC
MLGDRFLKEADVGFTAEPYVSEGMALGVQDEALLVVASDGLWDVVSQERAAAMAAKLSAAAAAAAGCAAAGSSTNSAAADGGSGSSKSEGSTAEGVATQQHQAASGGAKGTVAAAVAEALMNAALNLRSKDDISIMVLHVLPAAAAAASAQTCGVATPGGCL